MRRDHGHRRDDGPVHAQASPRTHRLSGPAARILELQRTAGNTAVTAVLQRQEAKTPTAGAAAGDTETLWQAMRTQGRLPEGVSDDLPEARKLEILKPVVAALVKEQWEKMSPAERILGPASNQRPPEPDKVPTLRADNRSPEERMRAEREDSLRRWSIKDGPWVRYEGELMSKRQFMARKRHHETMQAGRNIAGNPLSAIAAATSDYENLVERANDAAVLWEMVGAFGDAYGMRQTYAEAGAEPGVLTTLPTNRVDEQVEVGSPPSR